MTTFHYRIHKKRIGDKIPTPRPLCFSGDGHAQTTREKESVTCSHCLNILKLTTTKNENENDENDENLYQTAITYINNK